MSFIKVHRRGHQQRAGRLEARFSNPIQGGPQQPTATVLPNSAIPPSSADPAAHPSKHLIPVPLSPQPISVPPTTAPVVVPSPSPSPSATIPSVVLAPSVSTTSSSSLVPLPVTSSSSSSSVVLTTPIVVPTTSSKTPVFTTPTTFRNLPETTYTPTTTSSAVASATTSASSGIKTGSIIGICAASIAGVAILGVAGMWLLKRYFSSRDEDDDHPPFQRHSWMRNSVALPDDAPSPLVQGPSINPRPPTMIERKQTQRFANLSPRGYGENQGGYYQDRNGFPQEGNIGMAYSGYQDSPYGAPPMPSFNPGQHVGPAQNSEHPIFSPIGSPPLPSPAVASFDESTPPVQHASYDGAAMGAAAYFSRPDTNKAYPGPPAHDSMPNPHDNNGNGGYATLDRSSVTPYQAQQYAEITKQLEPILQPIAEGAGPLAMNEPSPFADPAPALAAEEQHQVLTAPSPAHTRIDSTPPRLPPVRTMSPVGAVAARPTIAQLANAFPATPTSPKPLAIPAAVASPSSPKSPSFKQPPPLSPAPSAQGQMVSVPVNVHAGRETPLQFGFNDPATVPAAADTTTVVPEPKPKPNPNRMSVASKKSIAKFGRPETVYDEQDAYGGF